MIATKLSYVMLIACKSDANSYSPLLWT